MLENSLNGIHCINKEEKLYNSLSEKFFPEIKQPFKIKKKYFSKGQNTVVQWQANIQQIKQIKNNQ